MTFFIIVLLAALAFGYTNGFHDAANAIATVISTKVLTPRQALLLATFFNLIGAMLGTAVAATISSGIVDAHAVDMNTVLAALLGAIVWNVFTWWLGLPSSSSHALIGGLCGAAIGTAHGDWSVLKWDIGTWPHSAGLWPKVIFPMVISPICGFAFGGIFMGFLIICLIRARPSKVQKTFGKLQILSASWMGLSHGMNDTQKTMGIVALALFTATKSGAFEHLSPTFSFLRMTDLHAIPMWVIIVCALTMAAGTAGGGMRIIRTLGHKMVRLQPVHGFAAETTSALIIQIASHFGIPLSTTHVISSSIMGVGATKRLSAVKWGIVQRIVWAWVLTLPAAGLVSYVCARLLMLLH